MLNTKLDCQYGEFRLQLEQALPTDQIIGLFGTSGSGKSRFIRQLLGFDSEHISTGTIEFGKQIWLNDSNNISLDPAKRGIGYLPQSIDLFPHLTAIRNITYAVSNTSRTNSTIEIDSVLKELDLVDLKNRLPKQLSGGQKQRVALARAIVGATQLLILDEPLSAQGETHKAQIMRYLKTLNLRFQLPIIFASHDRIEHAFLSQYLLTFSNGKIKQAGDYERIATDICGDFAQTSDAINHIKAKVVSYKSEFYLNELTTNSHQLWAGNERIEEHTEVALEVRAQDISLSLNEYESSSILNCLSVRIVDYSEIARHQYLVKLAFENNFLTTFITKKSFIELNLKKGHELFARFKSVSVKPISIGQGKQPSSFRSCEDK